MSVFDDLQAGAVQHRAAKIDGLDQSKSELSIKVVPYEVEGDVGPFTEVFSRGAFARATKDPSRLGVWHEHLGPLVGRGVEADDRADGFWMRAKLASTQAARDMAQMIDDKVLTDASVEFHPMRDFMDVQRRDSGKLHVRHRRAHLRGVAVTFEGAYGAGAYVASLRDAAREREIEEARVWFAAWRQNVL